MPTIGTRHEQGAVSPVFITHGRDCFPVMARLVIPKRDTLDRPPGASAPRTTERRLPTPSLADQPTLDRPLRPTPTDTVTRHHSRLGKSGQ